MIFLKLLIIHQVLNYKINPVFLFLLQANKLKKMNKIPQKTVNILILEKYSLE